MNATTRGEGDDQSNPRVGRILVRLAVLSFAYSLANGAVRPLVPLYAVELGATPALVGLSVAIGEVLPIFMALSVGALADVWGSRRLMLLGAVVLTVSSVLRAGVPVIAGLMAAQVVMGVAQLLFFLAAQSYVARLGSAEDRARHFGTWTFVTSAGQLLGPLFGGGLTDAALALGMTPLGAYRATFGATVIIGLVAVALATRLPQPRQALRRSGDAAAGVTRRAWKFLRVADVRTGALASATLMMTLSVNRSFFPLFLASQGFSTSTITLLYSAHPLASMAGRPFLAVLTKRFGERRVLAACLLAAAVGWGVVPFAGGHWAAIFVLTALAGAGVGIGTTLTMVVVASAVRSEERGLALSVRIMGHRIAETIGPVILGFVAAAGVSATFWAAAAFSTAGLIPLAVDRWAARRKPKNRVSAM